MRMSGTSKIMLRTSSPSSISRTLFPTHANDFETAKAYLARWSGDDTESDCEKVFYKAQILMLEGSKDERRKEEGSIQSQSPQSLGHQR